VSVRLLAAQAVSAQDIHAIALMVYREQRRDGSMVACTDFLERALNPRDPALDRRLSQALEPGTYASIDLGSLRESEVILYVEAYRSATPGGQVLAAGCAQVKVPDRGHAAVEVSMVPVTDADGDGFIGQFMLPTGTVPGPDCNDADPTVPGQVPCGQQCTQTADCQSMPVMSGTTGNCCVSNQMPAKSGFCAPIVANFDSKYCRCQRTDECHTLFNRTDICCLSVFLVCGFPTATDPCLP
jgi:hypothetical protein